MKPLLFIFAFIVISNFSFGQNFPSPTNFNIEVCYEWPGICEPGYDPGDTVYYYTFDAPDLTGIESELVGYNLYYNDTFMIFFTNIFYDAVTFGEGDYYVTAVYINPSGESLPSNIVYGEGPLLSVNDYEISDKIIIYPNPLPENQQLIIHSDYQIMNISVYDLMGKEIIKTTNNIITFSTNKKGLYIIKIESENGISTKKIIIE